MFCYFDFSIKCISYGECSSFKEFRSHETRGNNEAMLFSFYIISEMRMEPLISMMRMHKSRADLTGRNIWGNLVALTRMLDTDS